MKNSSQINSEWKVLGETGEVTELHKSKLLNLGQLSATEMDVCTPVLPKSHQIVKTDKKTPTYKAWISEHLYILLQES